MTWTPIARQKSSGAYWQDIEGAPMTTAEARKQYDLGEVEIAQRRSGDGFELVVKTRNTRAQRRRYFGH